MKKDIYNFIMVTNQTGYPSKLTQSITNKPPASPVSL